MLSWMSVCTHTSACTVCVHKHVDTFRGTLCFYVGNNDLDMIYHESLLTVLSNENCRNGRQSEGRFVQY